MSAQARYTVTRGLGGATLLTELRREWRAYGRSWHR